MRATPFIAAAALLLAGCAAPPLQAPSGTARAGASFPDKLLDIGTAYEQGTFHRIGSGLCEEINKARELAKLDPQAVANIIKDWMNANGS